MDSIKNDKYIYNSKTRNDILELTTLYMNYRNLYHHGFVRYGVIRNIIRHITGLKTHGHIRVIFNNLHNRDLFETKRMAGRLFYRYNPYKRVEKKETGEIIVDFN